MRLWRSRLYRALRQSEPSCDDGSLGAYAMEVRRRICYGAFRSREENSKTATYNAAVTPATTMIKRLCVIESEYYY